MSVPQQVARRLHRYVAEHGVPGQPLPSIRTLVGRWNVSHWSLRCAQALLAKEGLLEIRHGKGVFVSARAGRRVIGIFSGLDLVGIPGASFWWQAIRTLKARLIEGGFQAELYLGPCSPGQALPPWECGRFYEDAMAGRLDGAVLLNSPSHFAWKEWLGRCAIPMVGEGTPYRVDAPGPEMAFEAVRWLAEAGCCRLAFLGWNPRETVEAFCDAVRNRGLSLNPRWIRSDLHPLWPGAGWEELREIWSANDEKPDGLVIGDDVIFRDAILALHELGVRAPSLRLALFANRGLPRAERVPFPMLRLEVDPAQYGWLLADRMRDRMKSRSAKPRIERLSFSVPEMVPTVAAETGDWAEIHPKEPFGKGEK